MCVRVRPCAHVLTSEHVSHYKLKSLTGDFVYLISIKPPPLSTWESHQDFKKKRKSPYFINSKQRSKDCGDNPEEEVEEGKKRNLSKLCPP